MSERPAFVYATGQDERDHRSPAAFSRYARRELGVEVPVMRGRAVWYSKLAEEMEAHGWTWDDMLKAVRYAKARRLNLESVFAILYHVQKAQDWDEYEDQYDLQVKVAEALAVETDETWRRRLSLAKGQALRQVYEQWEEHGASGKAGS